ncbi:Lipid A export ATP-binding/permease protein MsbA [Granulosicoccus antarcticus IMCC3135]|uniref:Lipid A export ATP-binding/permease protein MsbA n=2 Tax=Granulosicoccus TaxID=437504 RepID=A0A2Z2NZ00_9GAMM|nr:lipid A export permease/ATP-binding protein MsbA [Granulosicoccus antarcticus]ASJ75008.1 Lipid A export ATP-binding/permease protein MsbA [Granulosicoccus antarcticus IMCC3135]
MTYKRLLAYVRPYRREFIIAVIGMVGYAVTDTAFAALMKPMLDGSFVEQDKRSILMVPLLIIGIFLVRGIAGFASTYYIAWIGWRVIKQLRSEIFEKYLTLPTSFYDRASSGELISRITFNSQMVANAASSSLTVMVRDTLTAIGLFGLMFYQSWQLSLAFLIIGPIIGVIVARVSRQFRSISRSIQGSMGDVSHVIQEAVEGARVIKIFGGQQEEMQSFELANESNRAFNMKETMVKAMNEPIVQLLVALALAVIVYIASSGDADDRISVGSFMSFITAMLLLFAPLKRMTSLNSQIQKGIAAGESLFAILDLESEHDHGTQKLEENIASIEYRNVHLRYQKDKPAVLSKIDLTIASGETVAFVGESGSGKTSLVNLLPRLYELESGAVLVNGASVEDYTLASLRSRIATVSQDVMLFNDTIASNIAYGSRDTIDEKTLHAACRAAHAHDFISRLPEGYDTMVGENGVMLSGGQKQRVAIARALLKNAPILILDEATSALDTESERKVQQGLDALMEGRTTLVIAHRLSTIEQATRIVVMDRGEIVEVGTHEELLARKSHYFKLHQLQFR